MVSVTGSEYSSIWIYDKPKSMMIRERDESAVREISMQDKKGLLYQCFNSKKYGIYNYLASEKGYDALVDNPDNIRMKSKIMVPMIDDDFNIVGVVIAYSSVKQIKNFTIDDLDVLKAIVPNIINHIFSMNNLRDKSKDNAQLDRRISDRRLKTEQNLIDIEESRFKEPEPNKLLDYVSNIVHDIRTPANGLFGFLELLQEQIEDPRLKQYISNAKESASLVNELTSSIIDGISSNREVSKSKIETVNTVKYFSKIAEIFSANMSTKGIQFNIFIDPMVPSELKLEEIKLKRIIMNLIGNAYKFTSENKTIEFSVRYKAKENKLHIFVKDSGVGIAKEKQEQIFEAFKQAEEDTQLSYGGTGLGLAISAGYVKELGGKLHVDSELNKGSVFYFDIPVVVVEESRDFKELKNKNIKLAIFMNQYNSFSTNNIVRYLVKMGIHTDSILATNKLADIDESYTHIVAFESKISEELLSFSKKSSLDLMLIEENFLSLSKDDYEDKVYLASGHCFYADILYEFSKVKKKPKVLVVDDDEISIALIKAILKDEDCIVDVASDSSDGLNMMISALNNNNPYPVVYLDSNMPKLSGEELLKSYRDKEKLKKLKKMKAISISGEAPKIKSRTKFDMFVGKPFDKREIKQAFLNSI
ncbi:MAG: hybrid sensor histidine kinase/response regulator [Campylobacterota bacterium]|nr:hybrid sensor histidine kinase/response regulator [Campylobacterota bacterium]